MKELEFYTKYKTTYTALVNPIFSKNNWGYVVLMAVVAVLIEPLIMYGRYRSFPFSFENYLQVITYLSFVMVPFVAFLFWVNWREAIKQSRGYGWMGTFEVTKKRLTFSRCYLFLAPGNNHKVKVDRKLFDKIRVGDFVEIRRDALGGLEAVDKVRNFSNHISKARNKRAGKVLPMTNRKKDHV
jgi:hypothetical protein